MLIGAILLLAGIFALKPFYQVEGAAFTGQFSYLQVSTSTVLSGTTATTLFQANSSCKARTITTTNSGIWLSFGDTVTAGDISSTTVSTNNGYYQATATTAVYDSGLFGCGRFTATSTMHSKIITNEF
jgi:hypothetical protein